MALKDFTEEYQIEKQTMYVCICVNQKMGYGGTSRVNALIQQLYDALQKEMEKYREIYVAYVYETRGLMDVKPFAVLKKDEKPYYKEGGTDAGNHKMEHIFFMGMELLAQHPKDERRLYLVTEERFPRVNQLVRKNGDELLFNERYADTDIEIRVCKPDDLGEDLLDEYLKTKNDIVRKNTK